MQNIHVEAGHAFRIGLVPFAVLVVTLTTAPPVAAQMLQAHTRGYRVTTVDQDLCGGV